LLLAAGLPIAIYAAVNWWRTRLAARAAALSPNAVGSLLTLLGVGSFAVLLPIGLAAWKTQQGAYYWQTISPLGIVLALPALWCGGLLWRRLTGPETAVMRTVGLSLGVGALGLIAAANVAAGPDPRLLLACAVLGAAVLWAACTAYDWPWGHAAVALFTGWGAWLAILLVGQRLVPNVSARELLAALLSGWAAWGLLLVTCALSGMAFWQWRRGQAIVASGWGAAAAVGSAAALAIVARIGFGVAGDTSGSAELWLLYAALALGCAWLTARPELHDAGSLLLLVGAAQLCVWTMAPVWQLTAPWLVALLVVSATLAALGLWPTRDRRHSRAEQAAKLLHGMAAVLLAAAAVHLGFTLDAVGFGQGMLVMALIAGLLFVIALARGWYSAFLAMQASLTTAVLFGMARICQEFIWYAAASEPLLHPRLWQIGAFGALGLAAGWLRLRLWARQRTAPLAAIPVEANVAGVVVHVEPAFLTTWLARAANYVARPVWSLDRILISAAFVLLLWLTCRGLAPGVIAELSPSGSSPLAAAATQIGSAEAIATPTLTNQALLWATAKDGSLESIAVGNWLLAASLFALLGIAVRFNATAWSRWSLALLLPTVCGLIAALGTVNGDTVTVARCCAMIGALLAGGAALRFAAMLSTVTATISSSSANHLLVIELNPAWGTRLFTLFALQTLFIGFLCHLFRELLFADPAFLQIFLFLTVLFCAAITVNSLVSGDSLWRYREPSLSWPAQLVTAIFVWSGTLILVPAAHALQLAVFQQGVTGPNTSSIFADLRASISYAAPIIGLALAIAVSAWRAQAPAAAILSSMLTVFGTLTGVILWGQEQSLGWTWERVLFLLECGVLSSAATTLLWRFIVARQQGFVRRAKQVRSSLWLRGWSMVPLALELALLIPGGLWLWLQPVATPGLAALGSVTGWLAFGLSFAVAMIVPQPRATVPRAVWLPLMLGLGGILVAGTLQQLGWDNGNWLGFHVWLASNVATTLLASALALKCQRGPLTLAERGSWLVLLTAFQLGGIALAARTLWGDPQAPWWAVGTALIGAVHLAFLALWLRARSAIYLSQALIQVAVTLVWRELFGQERRAEALVNMIVLTATVPWWLWCENRIIRIGEDSFALARALPWHRLASLLGLLGFALVVLEQLGRAATVGGTLPHPALTWTLAASVLMAMFSLAWDRALPAAGKGLYVAGLLICGLALCALELDPALFRWGGLIVVAAYTVATGYLWNRRAALAGMLARMGIPWANAAVDTAAPHWLIGANSLLVAGVLVGVTWAQFEYAEWELRIGAAKAGLLQSVALGILAWGRTRTPLQYAALAVGTFGAVLLGWSALDPTAGEMRLDYVVVALAALGITAVLYGFGFSKLLQRENDWTRAAARLVPVLLGICLLLLIGILSVEVQQFTTAGTVEIAPWAIATVAFCLLGLFGAALAAAVLPGRDPLQLTERQRGGYVYAAEALLAVLFAHIRLTMPWLFNGLMTQYWPLIVVALAFSGVGLSEWFRRRRQHVLAEPLENTGAFLPLLAVLGFWFNETRVHYSVLLVIAGGLYSVLALRRKSFGFSIVAMLLANGGLWYWLEHDLAWSFLSRPQTWCIPPALCVLIAAHLNRARLTAAQLTSLRYGSALVIYVSSTAEIFLRGVAENPWLPVILAPLSIAGVSAGIFWRIRSFLWLGTVFLFMSLLSIIWYAAVDLEQTWIWSACGIVTGIVIIAIFALFEKKRQEIFGVLAELKQWQE